MSMSSVTRHPSSVCRQPSSVMRCLSSVVCRHPLSVVPRHLLSVVRHPLSVICNPSSVGPCPLWLKKRNVTNRGLQLTSFDPKNVTWPTEGSNWTPFVCAFNLRIWLYVCVLKRILHKKKAIFIQLLESRRPLRMIICKKPSSRDFCSSCDCFEWSHDQFAAIRSLGKNRPKVAKNVQKRSRMTKNGHSGDLSWPIFGHFGPIFAVFWPFLVKLSKMYPTWLFQCKKIERNWKNWAKTKNDKFYPQSALKRTQRQK